jgi:hypothetical protein
MNRRGLAAYLSHPSWRVESHVGIGGIHEVALLVDRPPSRPKQTAGIHLPD